MQIGNFFAHQTACNIFWQFGFVAIEEITGRPSSFSFWEADKTEQVLRRFSISDFLKCQFDYLRQHSFMSLW